jgi:hypothetical protein
MNEAQFAKSIKRVWTVATAMGVAESFAVPTSLNASDEFIQLARSRSTTYEELYLLGLETGQNNIVLADYAYLQFSRTNDGLRYAYYPNPFLTTSRASVAELAELREYVEEGVIELEEFLHRVAELRHSQHPPLVRYEYAPDQYVELRHPSAHFHLGHHSENRFAAKRILSPAAFGSLFLKLFYSDYWVGVAPIPQRDGTQADLDDLLIKYKRECQILPDDLFSVKEAAQFYIA